MKGDLEQRETEIQQSKEYLRKKENEKLVHEKELSDHNTNKQMLLSQTANKEQHKSDFARDVHEMERKDKRLEKELSLLITKNTDLREERDQNEAYKEKIKVDL